MKRITITYHMEKRGDVAENCITIPASDETLQAIFGAGPDDHTRATMDVFLDSLADLAGYDCGYYIGAEMALNQFDDGEGDT